MERLEFPAGAVIVMVGDPATRAFRICKGTVELRRGTAGLDDCETQLGPGDVFGEMGLVSEQPYTTSARAVSDVQLFVLPRAEFELLLSGVPEDYAAFLQTLFSRLRTVSSDLSRGNGMALTKRSNICVTIHPLSRRAAATLPRDGLKVVMFPFRIGRAAVENEAIPKDMNDLWLSDQLPFNVSRNHAVIDRDGDDVILKDCGSSLGMYANEVQIGGRSQERQMCLDEGDNIVVLGGPMSPYQFRVNIARE